MSKKNIIISEDSFKRIFGPKENKSNLFEFSIKRDVFVFGLVKIIPQIIENWCK